MKQAYPIILTRGEQYIVVYIPDFDINTQGEDISDAIYMARDAIGIIGIDMQDDGQDLPAPSDIFAIKNTRAGDIVTLVDVDFEEYRRKNDLRTVKKNCTIPSWLNFEAEKAGLNFSAILQSGLKHTLGLKD
mgnify:CR=1 FL=1